MEFLLSIYILASFAGAAKRATDREIGLLNSLKFIGEFIFYPVVRALEDFEIDLF